MYDAMLLTRIIRFNRRKLDLELQNSIKKASDKELYFIPCFALQLGRQSYRSRDLLLPFFLNSFGMTPTAAEDAVPMEGQGYRDNRPLLILLNQNHT